MNRMVCRSRRVASASVGSYLEVPWSKACEDAGAVVGVGLIAGSGEPHLALLFFFCQSALLSPGVTNWSSVHLFFLLIDIILI